jgi:hypothetical protein
MRETISSRNREPKRPLAYDGQYPLKAVYRGGDGADVVSTSAPGRATAGSAPYEYLGTVSAPEV